MDPVSFAVGIISLAGLFSTCLDVVDRFGSFKEFGNESRALNAQFKAQKLRLESWGQAAGFQGKLLEKHNRLLDDRRIYATVEELLLAIKAVCSSEDDSLQVDPSLSPTEGKSFKDQVWPRHGRNAPQESKRAKLGWALRNKAKRMAQVRQFSTLVDNLHSLVPTDGSRGDHNLHVLRYGESQAAQSDHHHTTFLSDEFKLPDRNDWTTDFARILNKIETDIEDEIKRDLHPWLLASYSQNELFEISVARRLDGTCEWALTQSWFLDWATPDFPDQSAKVLWINGPAGFGKSILCAKIIEQLVSTSSSPVANFFFSSDFETRRDPFFAMRAWISQMICHDEVFALTRQSASASQGRQSTRGGIVRLLKEIVTTVPSCTFVIDGLDECGCVVEGRRNGDNDSVPEFLDTLMSTISGTPTRLLIVSRDEPDIRNSLSDNIAGIKLTRHKISPQDVRSDTEIFSRSIVDKKLSNRNESTKDDITTRLADHCNGQFLWVKMQEECLRSGKSQKQIEQAITSTPPGIEHTYERNWVTISGFTDQDRKRTVSLLRWIAFALRPLTVNEITGALLINEDDEGVQRDELPDSIDEDYINTEILNLCGSLVEIRVPQNEHRPGLKTLHLAHFSVKQYLLTILPNPGKIMQFNSTFDASAETVHSTLLATTCLRFVNSEDSWAEESEEDVNNTIIDFRSYASFSWYKHGSMGNRTDSEYLRLVNKLFDMGNANWRSWKRCFDLNDELNVEEEALIEKSEHSDVGSVHSIVSNVSDRPVRAAVSSVFPIYYAARLGLVEIMDRLLIGNKQGINEKGKSGETPLAVVCRMGDLQIAQKLLANGADIETVDDIGDTPLSISALNGHLEIVKLLLEQGALPQPYIVGLRTPLHGASYNGHLEVVRLLLRKGADPTLNTVNLLTPLYCAALNGHILIAQTILDYCLNIETHTPQGWTPLHGAASNGHLKIVKLLLEKGFDPESRNIELSTPLHFAAVDGHLEIVKLLIDKGADLQSKNKNLTTPLHNAAENGHHKIVELLLEKGADPQPKNFHLQTPLHFAVAKGHIEIVHMLLDRGADYTAPSKTGWRPFHITAQVGVLELLQLFHDRGVDINIPTHKGETALEIAIITGHAEIAKFLIEKGANLEACGPDLETPLICAVLMGDLEIVRILIEKGANIEHQTRFQVTPLSCAAKRGQAEIVQMLVNSGANIDTPNMKGQVPLHLAIVQGHTDIVRILLENGANHAVRTKRGWAPIGAASWIGDTEVIKILLESGANVEARSTKLRTPLHLAALSNSVGKTTLILEKEPNLNALDSYGYTPLMIAIFSGYLEIAKLLLEKGASYQTEDNLRRTTVFAASEYNQVEILKLLLAQEPPPSLTKADELGATPLAKASQNGHSEIVKILLDNGADVSLETPNHEYMTPLYSACLHGHIEVVGILISEGANISTGTMYDEMPLTVASYYGETEIVRLLLANGADINQSTNSRGTPLNNAMCKGHDSIALLLEHGADLHIANTHGRVPLHTSVRRSNVESTELLFQLGKPDIEARDLTGRTALFHATELGFLDQLKLLISKGASIDAKDIYGATPLMAAVRNGHEVVVQYLLSAENSPDTQAKDCWGRTLLWWAFGSECDEVVELVRQHTVSTSTRDLERSPTDPCSLVKYDKDLDWCNVCTRAVTMKEFHWKCTACFEFSICSQCVGFGAECMDPSHTWDMKDRDIQTDTESEADESESEKPEDDLI
ncbi:hypothetical protein N7478_009414 [Penicillium angulare]|uniref:uncharacterized protein n=1 Tax=Penicillium angulare TaxID=116970 RepID=UPI002540A96F|nr:uncharacterized protein N7478_009414 [Penicillium angulare]KAJ5266606.1 hypothetical protein N7478_009414 [Penicillium angulare]